MTEEEGTPEELSALRRRIHAAKNKKTTWTEDRPPTENPIAIAMRYATELIACLIAGLLTGYILDQITGLTPIFMIALFPFGLAAGFMSIYRTNMKNSPEEEKELKKDT